jgi:hypothetical protein
MRQHHALYSSRLFPPAELRAEIPHGIMVAKNRPVWQLGGRSAMDFGDQRESWMAPRGTAGLRLPKSANRDQPGAARHGKLEAPVILVKAIKDGHRSAVA